MWYALQSSWILAICFLCPANHQNHMELQIIKETHVISIDIEVYPQCIYYPLFSAGPLLDLGVESLRGRPRGRRGGVVGGSTDADVATPVDGSSFSSTDSRMVDNDPRRLCSLAVDMSPFFGCFSSAAQTNWRQNWRSDRLFSFKVLAVVVAAPMLRK